MEILGGPARGMSLKVPAGMEVRPTSVRSRRALFDTLGGLSGVHFCDLFAGSGAVGLEAASRGASHVLLVEKSPHVLTVIRDNVRRLQKLCPDAMLQVVPGTVPECFRKLVAISPEPDLIFADPPYAESANLLDTLLRQVDFCKWAQNATLIWELPDYRTELKIFPPEWELNAIRDLGASRFLIVKRKKNA